MKKINNRRRKQKGQLYSIRVKLFLLRIGIGVTMSVIIGVGCYYGLSSLISTEQYKYLARDSRIIEDHIGDYFSALAVKLKTIAHSEEVKKYQLTSREALLKKYFSDFSSDFDMLSYVGPNGLEEVKDVRGSASDMLFDLAADKDYLRAQGAPGQAILSPRRVIDELEGQGMYYDLLATDFFDQKLCFIRAAISLERFASVVEQALIQEFATVVITTKAGDIVYSPESQDLTLPANEKHHRLHNLFLQPESRGKGDLREVLIQDNLHLVSKTELTDLDWNVYVFVSFDELRRPIRQFRAFIISIAIIVVVIGELLSRFVGLRLTEPIAKLNKLALKIVHSGRVSDRVEWQSMDELGELANSFNLMLDRLGNARQELGNEKLFVDSVVASMVDGLFTTSEQGAIVMINDVLLEMLDCSEDEIIGQHYESIFPEDRPPLHGKDKLSLVDDEFLRLDDTRIVRKNGQQISVACTVSTINDSQEQPHGLLFIIKDIRQQKQLERERTEAEYRLRETQDELFKTEKVAVAGQMAGMIAHEVLNPISAVNVRVDLNLKKAKEFTKVIDVLSKIINDWQRYIKQDTFAEYFAGAGEKDMQLLEKIFQTLEKRQADYREDLEFMDRQVQRIIKIIDGLREMSRREKTLEKIFVSKLLDEVLDDMRDAIQKRRITVHKEYAEEPAVMADYMEIYSIFSNILKNALQAIDIKGDFTNRNIFIRMAISEGTHAIVEIEDTGIGMEAESQKAVFEAGFTSKGREGTGIGSSFSRKLARQYGGDVEVKKSEPGIGTTFVVLLALATVGEENG